MPCDMALQVVLNALPGQLIGFLLLTGVLTADDETLRHVQSTTVVMGHIVGMTANTVLEVLPRHLASSLCIGPWPGFPSDTVQV